LTELQTAATDAETQVGMSEADLGQAEGALDQARKALAALGEEDHRLQLEKTEVEGKKRGLVERVETEWRKPLDTLLTDAPEVPGDIEWLRQENDRLRGAIDAVGPVNALAVEEHAEETKRLEFLQTQRDDLVTARNSLQQAAREIDQTAKALFASRTRTSRSKAKSKSTRHPAASGRSASTCSPRVSAPSWRCRCCSRSSSPNRARSASSTRSMRRSTTPTWAATCGC